MIIFYKKFFLYIIDTNHISQEMIGYKKGEKIKISKEYLSFKIIREFLYKIIFCGCLLYWIDCFYLTKWVSKLLLILSKRGNVLLKPSMAIIVILELVVLDKYLSPIVKKAA